MAEVTLKGYDNSIVHEILQKSLNSCSSDFELFHLDFGATLQEIWRILGIRFR